MVSFFRILKANWDNIPYPIVLNTESKNFMYDDLDIKCFQLYQANEKVPWGKRLIDTLSKIESEYILFMLDDFFLLDKVDDIRLNQCMEWMDNNHNIAVFSFLDTPGENIQDNKYPNFEKRPQNGEYRLNCQAAIWRREKLISYIRPHESPWDWEIYGSIRSSRYKEDFYSLIENSKPIISYKFKEYGVIRGKWAPKTTELFDAYDIEIDFSQRGFYENYNQKINDWYMNPLVRLIIKVRSYFLIQDWKNRYIKFLSTKK